MSAYDLQNAVLAVESIHAVVPHILEHAHLAATEQGIRLASLQPLRAMDSLADTAHRDGRERLVVIRLHEQSHIVAHGNHPHIVQHVWLNHQSQVVRDLNPDVALCQMKQDFKRPKSLYEHITYKMHGHFRKELN